MTVQFNPPPGWHVPQGWMPPFGWKKPKRWPEAPQGWEFYLELPEGMVLQTHQNENIVSNNPILAKEQEKTIKSEDEQWWPWKEDDVRNLHQFDKRKNFLGSKIIFFMTCVSLLSLVGLLIYFFFAQKDGIPSQTLEACYTDIRNQATNKAKEITPNLSTQNENSIKSTNKTDKNLVIQQNLMMPSPQNDENQFILTPITEQPIVVSPGVSGKNISGVGRGGTLSSFSWECSFIAAKDKTMKPTWEYSKGKLLPADNNFSKTFPSAG